MENSTITYDDFVKVELRVGTIINAARVPKSEKLLHLAVSFGNEIGVRNILAGIGKDFDPESVLSKKVVAVLNMPPRKMMGLESNGMLLAAHDNDGKLSLVTCPGVPDGSKIG